MQFGGNNNDFLPQTDTIKKIDLAGARASDACVPTLNNPPFFRADLLTVALERFVDVLFI